MVIITSIKKTILNHVIYEIFLFPRDQRPPPCINRDNLYSWFSKSAGNQEADTWPAVALSREDCFFIPFIFFTDRRMPRECKLIRYCIWDARIRERQSPYWIPWLETGITRRFREGRKRGLEAKKKRKKKGGWAVRFRPSFSSPLRFVIEGVSSRSENRGALLVSVDLKMYPFLSFSLSLKKLNGISSSNSAFDFYCHFFLRPGPISRL